MADENFIFTTSDGIDFQIIMAPPGHGAGAAVIIPNFPTRGGVSKSSKWGYTKPSPWPSR